MDRARAERIARATAALTRELDVRGADAIWETVQTAVGNAGTVAILEAEQEAADKGNAIDALREAIEMCHEAGVLIGVDDEATRDFAPLSFGFFAPTVDEDGEPDGQTAAILQATTSRTQRTWDEEVDEC